MLDGPTGLIAKAAAAGASGTFTGAGVMNTTMLAARFGVSALPVGYPGGGGTNYANGSAQTDQSTLASQYATGFINRPCKFFSVNSHKAI